MAACTAKPPMSLGGRSQCAIFAVRLENLMIPIIGTCLLDRLTAPPSWMDGPSEWGGSTALCRWIDRAYLLRWTARTYHIGRPSPCQRLDLLPGYTPYRRPGPSHRFIVPWKTPSTLLKALLDIALNEINSHTPSLSAGIISRGSRKSLRTPTTVCSN